MDVFAEMLARRIKGLWRCLRLVPVLFSGLVSVGPAYAYIGPSFLDVPGLEGGWQVRPYKDWVKLEANYWGEGRRSPPLYQGESRLFFSGPQAPRSGAGRLSLSLDKRSAAYAGLMELCARNEPIPEMTYAESSDRARPPAELGQRPADIPAYYEYSLKNVSMKCPDVAEAPEQALVLEFEEIAWQNFDGEGRAITGRPARLPAAQRSGRSRAYIVDWFASANSIRPDQCPEMSKPPTEADYYAFVPEEEVAAKRAMFAPKGGVLATFITGEVAKRGPLGLNVSLLPGIVPDPGLPSPQIDVARGFDLDGDGGKSPADGLHKDFVSELGEPGIDNQFFTVDGCIKGFGPKGILTATTTESRRNGETSMMVLISGIDDEQHDDRVDITIFFSPDPMLKSADGKLVLPGFTFRVTDDPQRTPYFQRVRGRIVDGVVITDPADELQLDKGRDIMRLFGGRMRLEMRPDRRLKGLIGGYQDWHNVANYWGAVTIFEVGLSYQMPAVYNALKRAADGLKDPVTGEFNGISTAFDIEGVEAYLPPEELAALLRPGLAYAK